MPPRHKYRDIKLLLFMSAMVPSYLNAINGTSRLHKSHVKNFLTAKSARGFNVQTKCEDEF